MVRETLSTLPGVAKVEVSFAKESATVTMNDAQSLITKQATLAVLKPEGYEITSFVNKTAKPSPNVYVLSVSGMV